MVSGTFFKARTQAKVSRRRLRTQITE